MVKKLSKKEILRNLEKIGFFKEIWQSNPGLDFEHYFSEAYKLTSEEKEENVLINLSGHDAITFQVSDPTDILSVISTAEELLQHIIKKEEWFDACKNGKATLVLPSMTILNNVFIAMYHAIFGYFPKVKWYTRNEEGFKLVDEGFDLQIFRDQYRAKRQQLF
ncbi:MAG: hypothetical protein ACTSRR_09685 [Candidatus Heimdallarchaeaceae archaeon]